MNFGNFWDLHKGHFGMVSEVNIVRFFSMTNFVIISSAYKNSQNFYFNAFAFYLGYSCGFNLIILLEEYSGVNLF